MKFVYLCESILNMLADNKMRHRILLFTTNMSAGMPSILWTLLKLTQLIHTSLAINTMDISRLDWVVFRYEI